MELKDVQRLAKRGEGQLLEFKKKANYPEKIMKELVAFANSNGGTLLLGVDDNGDANGVREIDGETFLVEDAIEKLIRPKLNYSVEIIRVNEKKGIAVFQIEESHKKPHFVKDNPKTRQGTAYIRCADESLKASREMREIIRRRLKAKDIQFTYGDKENTLLKLLDEKGQLSLQEFTKSSQLPTFVASRTLIRLVLANVLEVKPSPKGDLYSLKK
ncbi:helix-turn-helix domain-containing protein [Roseivirga pacifica]|uniref:AlbA family DNA-binding domain-containing protein n=1 Tax=Roseivirga pacifica TaxID=1267423 RepID=UPI00227AA90F|nr:ATP-binding protein [Roseivirga pacifica]